ncbi:MAG: nucleoside deaminase [Candidatus Devosia euplotis]|nr:nucleoside deaminase [Candidatus Devosia euplotis]
MRVTAAQAVTTADLVFMRQAIAQSEKALADGERPFGAVIVGPDGVVIAENHGRSFAGKDLTAHAELTAVRSLSDRYGRDYLLGSTLYSSTEPYAMRAGTIYWAHIGRLIYGISEERLRDIRNATEPTALTIKAESILDTGGHPTLVIGPALEEEAVEPRRKYWLSGKV